MFAGSIATVALIVIIAFLFRSSIKQANKILPEVVNTGLITLAKGANQLDRIVTVNCLEDDAELNARAIAVTKEIEAQGGLQDLNALYSKYHRS